jgi:Family of unknown function (DUF6492)
MARGMPLAIITPAFSKHLPLLELSAESVDRFCPEEIKHYIIVSGHEYRTFRHFNGIRRQVIIAEDVLPLSAFCLPLLIKGREVWLFDWHRAVRGWIVQQVLKLCAPEITDADVFLYLDTDVFFVGTFALEKVIRNGRVRLWKDPGKGRLTTHMRWHRAASNLLGLTTCDYYGADFIGNVITWRRDVVLEIRDRITEITDAHWLRSVVRQVHFSEYILYGVYVQELLGPQDLRHLPTNDELCLDSWYFMDEPGDRRQILAQRLRPCHIAVNIQSNLYLPTSKVRELVEAAISFAEQLSS